MIKNKAYRGYIGGRSYRGEKTPQHIQNLVIRDYCQRNDARYLLSAAEYNMQGCYMVLEEVLRDLSSIDGIVMYSIFMLPESRLQRYRIYDDLFDKNISLHGALENINIDNKFSVERLEEILLLQQLMYEQSNDTFDYLTKLS